MGSSAAGKTYEKGLAALAWMSWAAAAKAEIVEAFFTLDGRAAGRLWAADHCIFAARLRTKPDHWIPGQRRGDYASKAGIQRDKIRGEEKKERKGKARVEKGSSAAGGDNGGSKIAA